MKILECKNLTKEYKSGDISVKALDNVTLQFEKGEFCAVTGPSGSGKSTLLHILSSLERPTGGEIFYDGKSLLKYNDNQLSILRRRRFGFVFQSYNLVQELTGLENILLPVMLDRKKPDEGYINRLIEVLGIGDRVEHLPSALSGGQQQRIAVARALANKPTVLFADEPTGNLDVKSGKEVLALLKQVIRELDITLILVTHDPHIAAMADRVVTIVDGGVKEDTAAAKEENAAVGEGSSANKEENTAVGEGSSANKEENAAKNGADAASDGVDTSEKSAVTLTEGEAE